MDEDQKPKQPKGPEPEAEAASAAETPQDFIAPREAPKPPAATNGAADEPPPSEAEAVEVDELLGTSRWARFKHWYTGHKRVSIPLSVLVLLIILLALPASRYPLASALGLKQNFTVQVLDSTTHGPVSGAIVSAGSISGTTDGSGKATLQKVKVGNASVSVSKKYYQNGSLTARVPILKQKNSPSINLVATGRQVKIKVTNLVSQKGLADVDIKVLDITAKTDSSGTALVVLPAGTATQPATLSLAGYNNMGVKVAVSDQTVQENSYKLVPAGKIYFLTNRSGKVDVMKTNLDGGNPELVLAGTGYEDEHTTILIASGDQKYLALLSRRTTDAEPHLYVIPTNTDKLLEIDSGSVTYEVEGWSGDYLIYALTHKDLSFQPGKSKLKSYNATNGQLNILDQSAAVGDAGAYAYELYAKVLLSGSTVVFAKNWTVYWQPSAGEPQINLSGKQNTLISIGADGQHRSQIAAFDDQSILPSYTVYGPNSLYIWQRAGVDNTFLSYTVGGSTKTASITPDEFYKSYPKYLASPSGKQMLWSEQRDGKNSLFIGDSDGGNAKQVDSGGDYAAYGWYSDQYLLVAKNNSELYIMSATGSSPVKITNYLQATGYDY